MITAIPTPKMHIYIFTLLASTPNSNSLTLRGKSRGGFMTSFLQQPLNVRGELTTSPNILQCLTEKMHGCHTHLKVYPALHNSRVEGISKCQEKRKKKTVWELTRLKHIFLLFPLLFTSVSWTESDIRAHFAWGGLHLIAGLKVQKSKDKCLVPPAGQ